jgi:hypothetical protein
VEEDLRPVEFESGCHWRCCCDSHTQAECGSNSLMPSSDVVCTPANNIASGNCEGGSPSDPIKGEPAFRTRHQ